MAVEIPVVIDIEAAFSEAAKKVGAASAPLRKSIEELNNELSLDIGILNTEQIDSDLFKEAAKDIQLLTQTLGLANDEFRRFSSNEGSIKRLNGELASLNRRWEEMGALQKFTSGGELSEDAKKLRADYKRITEEIQKAGKSLEQIEQEERRIDSLKQKGIRNRQYENAILSSTVKTMRILQEKERILSDRLNRTTIGSSKYRSLKNDLEQVRREIELVNHEVKDVTVPSVNKTEQSLAKLVKRWIALTAVHAASSFVRNVREVTAEFELQKVALGSIIQDTEKANSLFKQIKAKAVESPFEIKNLVTYTKQLSAYQIETEKLFDTTMKLADISAGLGVDMGRLILAFGQVRAAAVLRGQELRQFTEAGIPLVEKLAKKFEELNGRAVTTAEVFELISKRAVPFSMIEDIFNDLTSAGGAFYKMQEKQAETLLGQWNNLKDAISIMYDEIGNTSSVHSAMENIIKNARTLMQNWKMIADMIKYSAIQFGAMKIATMFLPTLTRNTKLLEKAELAEARAKQLSNTAHGNKIIEWSSKSLRAYSYFTLKAARSVTGFGRALNTVKAAITGSWMTLAITAITIFASKLLAARLEAARLGKELSKIQTEGVIKTDQSVRNFERLAKAATNAADGSKAQKDAVDELSRTYGDLLPASDKIVDKLREMRGDYKSLTDAIREKINMQILEQQVDTVTSEYGSKISSKRDRLKKYLKDNGLSTEEISVVMEQLQNAVRDGLISVEQTMEEQARSISDLIYKYTGTYVKLTRSVYRQVAGENKKIYAGEQATALSRTFSSLVELFTNMDNDINEVNSSMKNSIGVIGRYRDEWKDLQDQIKIMPISGGTKFEQDESRINNYVSSVIDFIQKKFGEHEIDISSAIVSGRPDFAVLKQFAESVKDESAKASIKSIIAEFQKEYEKLVPDDKIRDASKKLLLEVSDTLGMSMDKLRSYIKSASASNETYLKELKESLEAYIKTAQFMRDYNEQFKNSGLKLFTNEQITEQEQYGQALQYVYDNLSKIIKLEGGKGGHQDPLIEIYKNRTKFVQDFAKGVEDLNKYMTENNALMKEREIMEGRGKSLGFNGEDGRLDVLKMTGSRAEVLKWYDDTIKEISEKIGQLGGATWSKLGVQAILARDTKNRTIKAWQELLAEVFKQRTDYDLSNQKKDLEDAIKRLSDEIKRSEVARNFYQNILDTTGDEKLAASMSISIYGGLGQGFKSRIESEIEGLLSNVDTSTFSDELKKGIEDIDFSVIMAHIDEMPEKLRDSFRNMADAQQKFSADQMNSWLKDLKAYQTYGEKRVRIAKKTAQNISDISTSSLPIEVKESLISQYQRKEMEEVAKLRYEAFKDSPMYVHLFEDLDAASTTMLKNMRYNLDVLGESWKDLDPKNLREMQKRIEEIDERLAGKNPFRAMTEGLRDYFSLTKQMTREEAELAAIRATDASTSAKAELDSKTKSYEISKKEYEDIANSKKATDAEKIAALEKMQIAKQEMEIQANIVDSLEEQAHDAQNTAEGYERALKHIMNGAKALAEYRENMSTILTGVRDLAEALGSDKFSLSILDDFNQGMNSIFSGAESATVGLVKAMSGDIIGGLAGLSSGIGSIAKGFVDVFYAQRIASANKEIEYQQRLLEDLSSTYDKLSNVEQKVFGADYISNYNARLKALRAQEIAYQKQADAERSKGKKKDEDKIREYEKSAREAAERITEMQSEVSERFLGSDLASAARDFADAWISAYKEFSSTTDAMKEKFGDMIQNMIVESLAAKIIEGQLKEVFDLVDSLSKEDNQFSIMDAYAVAERTKQANAGINTDMSNFMNALSGVGLNVRTMGTGLTGIAKDLQGASEESILGLAAGVNTQNFYMAQINENVLAIVQHLRGETPVSVTPAPTVDYANSEEFITRMYNLDVNLATLLQKVDSVITPKNTSSNTHCIAIK